ncbi:MAG: phospholipid/cholesterol/gamma-HCH transport system substrate-binding protein, partial [Mycobacterium sp.]|nr:phospholipid/cholesterol/gamma-HCH transport system substrate-binding protein [Mycobacterium sp.]
MPPISRVVRIQLVVFAILAVFVLATLGWYYLQVPSLVGIGQYKLYADLPASGGLYKSANVTYRGITIGKVTDVEPTETGARAVMSISDSYKIPVDSSANVHSVSAIGEQYLDLVSTGNPGRYFSNGQTIAKGTVPSEVGPALDAANNGLAVLPKDKIDSLLTETSKAVGGIGPALQRLVDSTTAIARDFRDNLNPVNDIVANSAPILNSQVTSRDAIDQWAANLNSITAQTAEQDSALRSGLQQAAPTLDAVTSVFSNVRDALPQTLANLEVVIDLLKRYHKWVEQWVVTLPQNASASQMATIFPGQGILPLGLTINQPPPCFTGFLPASEWRSPADTSMKDLPSNLYCKIP